jgi:16S rRNA pseudouridine516 synthase
MLRLDRFLSNATAMSRTQAQRAIRAGRVSVDGVLVKQAAASVPLSARVLLDEAPVAPPLPRYFMLHKPTGVVCASTDPTHRTAISLLDLPNPEGLHFAGRLDIDATGLVLISDDGQWSHRIVSPARHCDKRYRVGLEKAPTEEALQSLRTGLRLRGEKKPTRPAKLECIDPREWLITLSEGRYHQVKRMFAAVGCKVVSLHRESIGALSLDPRLDVGKYRDLTVDEIGLF